MEAIEYVIVNAESWDDFDGPHEVFPEVYGATDRTNFQEMTDLALATTFNNDGTYVVRTKAEFEARRAENE